MTTTDPVAALVLGVALPKTIFTYAFATNSSYDPNFSSNASSFQMLDSVQQSLISDMLTDITRHSNLHFVLTSGPADITFGSGMIAVPGQPQVVAYSDFNMLPSFVTLDSRLPDAGIPHFGAHEVLHILGLGHADNLDPVQQTTNVTLMVATKTPSMPFELVPQVDDYIALDFLYDAPVHLAPADFIAGRLYVAAFGRAPDVAGLLVQVNALHTGTTELQLATNVWNSPEAQTRYAGANVGEILTSMYHNVLGREPDLAGLNYQAQAIYDGMSWGQMLLNFTQSAENANRHVDWLYS